MDVLHAAHDVERLAIALAAIGQGSSTEPDGADAQDAVVDETAVAGANQNDRSNAKDGDDLRTGAMVVSPSGRFIVMQRNTVTLVYDVAAATYHELSVPLLRVAFAKRSDTVFAQVVGGSVQAIDLATRAVRWTLPLPAAGVCSLLRVSDDDDALLVGHVDAVRVVDAAHGTVRSTTPTTGLTTYAAFVPGQSRALVVGPTVWREGGPHTPVIDVDLAGASPGTAVDVPNCESPIVAVPSGARAFLSPTYCSPGAQAVPGEVWTNPDPVSVIHAPSRAPDGSAEHTIFGIPSIAPRSAPATVTPPTFTHHAMISPAVRRMT